MLQTNPKSDYSYSYTSMRMQQSTEKRVKKENVKIMFGYILALSLIGLILVAYIGQSLTITHLNYQYNDLQQKLEQAEETNHNLKLKLAQNQSLAKIEKVARTKLHMVDPEKTEVVVLNNEKQVNPDITIKSEGGFFLARVIDGFLDRIGTVQAGELE